MFYEDGLFNLSQDTGWILIHNSSMYTINREPNIEIRFVWLLY
jgi:hypothetical protein